MGATVNRWTAPMDTTPACSQQRMRYVPKTPRPKAMAGGWLKEEDGRRHERAKARPGRASIKASAQT